MSKTNKEPLILVVNDDGITAPGIRNLVAEARQLGKVVVVAPDSPQSGMGHAVTMDVPLRLTKVEEFDGIESWQCSGTPADCVKIAMDQVLERKPDLCVSGINHGSNHSVNVLYSGTMSAAMEAGMEHLPAIGFSFCNYSHQADMSTARHYVKEVMELVLKSGLPKGVLLNVNVPDIPLDEVKGIKICRQADATWREEFRHRKDPFDRDYYWLTGEFIDRDGGEDTDDWALKHNYVSVVPVQYDLTAHHAISILNESFKHA